MLIVTQQIDDCERIAESINKYAAKTRQVPYMKYAVAYHTGNERHTCEVKLTDLKDYPVLVITHEAYKRAENKDNPEKSKMQNYESFRLKRTLYDSKKAASAWERSTMDLHPRKMRIVDECLDIVQPFACLLDSLLETAGVINMELRDTYREEWKAIDAMIKTLEQIHYSSQEREPTKWVMLRSKAITEGQPTDLSPLIQALKDARLDANTSMRIDWSHWKRY